MKQNKNPRCRLKDSPVQAYAVHPGIVETPLWRHMWSQNGCIGGIFSWLARTPLVGIKTAEQVGRPLP